MALPALLVDQLLDVGAVIHGQDGVVAEAVGRGGSVRTGSKQSSHVGVVIAVKRRASVQAWRGRSLDKEIKLGGLLDTGSGLALFGVRVAIVPEDRRVQVAHAGPGTGAIVDHEVEEVDRLLELVCIVEISIPRDQVGGERVARAGARSHANA